MIREEKRWITPEPVVLPEFVGEVQEETTAGAVEGEDLTLDGGGGDNNNSNGEGNKQEQEQEQESYAYETETEPATSKSTETAPAYKPKPVFTPSPTLEPDTAPGVGVLKKPEPAIDPVWQPWGATQPQTVPSLISKAKPLENKVKFVEESTAPKKISDFFGELSYAATGGKEGVEGSVETLKRVGIGEDTARKIVKGTQILGKAEAGALIATGAVALGAMYGPAVVAKGGEAIKKGAQSLDDLIEGVKAGRTALGGAY